MSEFKPIQTQEDFDAAVSERIRRERETLEKKFQGYDEMKTQNEKFNQQLADLQKALDKQSGDFGAQTKTVEELTGKVASYELAATKARIAHEMGIPYELSGRLVGADEAAIRADAEILSKLVEQKTPVSPLKSTEDPKAKTGDAAFKSLLTELRGEN